MFCRHVFGNINFLTDFAVFHVFWGISWDFVEIPEFRGSATARNIRSPVYKVLNMKKSRFILNSREIHSTYRHFTITKTLIQLNHHYTAPCQLHTCKLQVSLQSVSVSCTTLNTTLHQCTLFTLTMAFLIEISKDLEKVF